MTDPTQTITFEESVRKRPFLYLGNDRLVGLFEGLILDCISLCKTDKIVFEIIISGDNKFTFAISSQHDLQSFIKQFSVENADMNSYMPIVLKVISENFEILNIDTQKTQINFSLNKDVIADTNIDYLKLSEKILQVALLNRQTEIVVTDKRQKHLNQNYYHFPQGVFYLFDRATTEILGKPEFKLVFDAEINKSMYQIGLAYRSDWYPTPNVISFANDVHTVCGGSLVDGILEGLITSCKKYVKENGMLTFKIKRKKFFNGLIIVCAVRGDNFLYGGSFKETLENDEVKKHAKKITANLVSDFFKNNKDKADKFLWRFDTTQLTSGMY
jgi:DNA gyrase/topoisomerase IV subunit B